MRGNRSGFRLAAIAIAAVFAISGSSLASAAPQKPTPKPKVGVTCLKLNASVKVGNTALKCTRDAKGKLVWAAPKSKLATKLTAVNSATIYGSSALESATVSRSSVSTPMAMEFASSVPAGFVAAVRGPSGYEIIADRENGGSPDVVYPEPEDVERPNPALAPAVTGVTLESISETAATVRFIPRTDVTGPYQVYLRYGDSYTLKSADGNNPVMQFTDLTPAWDYVICTYYLQPRESEKACINVRTLGTRPVEPAPLVGPTGVVATAVDDTIEVIWNELSNASRYSVSIEHNSSLQLGGYAEVGGVRTHIRFNSGSVSPGLNYKVRVSALMNDGRWTTETMTIVRSNGSVPVAPAKLPAPLNLRVTDVTPTTVTVAWDADPAAAAGITSWQVVARYQTSYTATGAYPEARTFTIPNLSPGLGYQIIVSGFDSNTGIWTEEARVSVLLPTS